VVAESGGVQRGRAIKPTGVKLAVTRHDDHVSLPQPADLTSLVLRTDFRDDQAWYTLQTAINDSWEYPCVTYVSDPQYAGVSVQALINTDAPNDDAAYVGYLFLADAVTMTDEEHPLLAVDLRDEPGRTFRVPPRWYADISANLTIANMCFHEFADAVDASGTYRGFELRADKPSPGEA
jgi:hypothetical protein